MKIGLTLIFCGLVLALSVIGDAIIRKDPSRSEYACATVAVGAAFLGGVIRHIWIKRIVLPKK